MKELELGGQNRSGKCLSSWKAILTPIIGDDMSLHGLCHTRVCTYIFI
jgi:hypothetical protein